MGGSTYSADITRSYLADHKTKGTDAFVHMAAVSSGAAPNKVHALVDPAGKNKAGIIIRESRDSDAHPDSVAVSVIFDTTGSMSRAPRVFIEKLPALMAALVKKGYLAHPHVMFGAINDATTGCTAPLQLGQFEAGNEMDAAVSHLLLEGGGGGHVTESYELAMYFLANHASMDCFEKRGKKGYLFLLGDELPYERVSAAQVKRIIGDDLQDDIPTKDVLAKLREKFEVFWIMPGGTSHWSDPEVVEPLKDMFVQNYLRLEDPAAVCELIVSTIGLMEGYDLDGIKSDLKDIGADDDAIAGATSALVAYAASGSVAKTAKASDALVPAGDDGAVRL